MARAPAAATASPLIGERVASLEARATLRDQDVADMRKKVDATHDAVTAMKSSLDTFIAQMAKSDERAIGLEVRTRKLEGRQWWMSGFGAAIGVVAGMFGVHIKT